MKRVLIVAATQEEIESAQIAYNDFLAVNNDRCVVVEFLVTGIGSNNTTYFLTKSILDCEQRYDYVINIGIAGAYRDDIKMGEAVIVNKEQFADLGVVGRLGFQTLFQYEILDANTKPYINGALYSSKATFELESILNLRKVSAVTVQTVTGIKEKNDEIFNRFSPDIETMEGAAFFYVCLMEDIPFLEIRGVSNIVGERDVALWHISEACTNVQNVCLKIFNLLAE